MHKPEVDYKNKSKILWDIQISVINGNQIICHSYTKEQNWKSWKKYLKWNINVSILSIIIGVLGRVLRNLIRQSENWQSKIGQRTFIIKIGKNSKEIYCHLTLSESYYKCENLKNINRVGHHWGDLARKLKKHSRVLQNVYQKSSGESKKSSPPPSQQENWTEFQSNK